VKVELHAFLTLALDGGQWSASCPGLFTPWERAPVPIGQKARWAPKLVWTTGIYESCFNYVSYKALNEMRR